MVTVSARACPAKPVRVRCRAISPVPRRRAAPPIQSVAPTPIARVLMRFSREHLAGFIEVAIDLLDLADDNPAFQLPRASIEPCRDGDGDLRGHHSSRQKFETGDTTMNASNAPTTASTAQRSSSLLVMLAERNALIDRIDTEDLTKFDAAEESAQLNRQEAAILATPAASRDDILAKLLLLVQSVTEGVVLEEADAAAVVREACALIGAGRVSPNVCNQVRI